MYKKLAVFLAVLSCVSLLSAQSANNAAKANDYVDKLLEFVKRHPVTKSYFELITINDKFTQPQAELKNFKITGLMKMYRDGESSISQDGKNWKVNTEITIKDINSEADSSYKPVFKWYPGKTYSTVDWVKAKIEISVTTDGLARINSLTLNLGPYKVRKITGCGAYCKPIIREVTKYFNGNKEEIASQLAEVVKGQINSLASKVKPVPVPQ